MPVKHTPSTFAASFWAKVKKIDGGCWIWTGSLKPSGYGAVLVRAKSTSPQGAHRIAYELMHGPIPEGMHVLHRCDNPPCVNAESHLFLGTPRDNAQDKIRKGRGPSSKGRAIGLKGERHGRAKVSWDDVTLIRQIYQAGGTSMAALGQRFGITTSTVFRIVRWQGWLTPG